MKAVAFFSQSCFGNCSQLSQHVNACVVVLLSCMFWSTYFSDFNSPIRCFSYGIYSEACNTGLSLPLDCSVCYSKENNFMNVSSLHFYSTPEWENQFSLSWYIFMTNLLIYVYVYWTEFENSQIINTLSRLNQFNNESFLKNHNARKLISN